MEVAGKEADPRNSGCQHLKTLSAKEESTGAKSRLQRHTEREGETLLPNIPLGRGGSEF